MSAGSGPPGVEDPPVHVELRRVQLPLRTPHVTWSGRLDQREVVLVQVTLASGAVGWGECPSLPAPTYTADYTDAAWAVLRDVLVPDALRSGTGGRRPAPVVGSAMARAALDDAGADARARAGGVALVDRLAALAGSDPSAAGVGPTSDGPPADEPTTGDRAPGPVRRSVPTTTVLSGWGDLDELVERAGAAAAAGSVAVKLKLERDLDPVWAVRSTFPDLLLAVDLNGGYRPGADDDRLLELDRLGLAYVEQPYPAALGWSPLLDLRSRMDTPVALDESITDLASAEAALLLGAASILNVKPARVGGGDVAAAVLVACDRAGAGAFVGGLLETAVGRAHALAVAALPGCTLPTDLGPSSQYFEQDVAGPIERRPDGTLPVPSGPGLGLIPDPDRLEAVTVGHLAADR